MKKICVGGPLDGKIVEVGNSRVVLFPFHGRYVKQGTGWLVYRPEEEKAVEPDLVVEVK